MSRIRSLKPEFFRSRSLARVSPLARLTFQGLWCEADDYGIGIAHADLLKSAVWPLDHDITATEVEQHLQDLERTGHIALYVVDDERYYSVLSWESNQAAALRRGARKYPEPHEGVQADTPHTDPPHDSARESVQEARVVVLEKGGEGSREQGEEQGAEFAVVNGSGVSPSARRPDIDAVFSAWQEATGHHKAVLDPKRKKVITNALKHYSADDLIDACRGIRSSAFHNGRNDDGTVYDGLDLILRDAEHIEKFRDLARNGPRMPVSANMAMLAKVVGHDPR